MNATLPMTLFDDRLFAVIDTGESMSDCSYLPLISAYHDGELSDDRTVDVESHLGHCADCRAELEQLRNLSSSFADLNVHKMPVTSRLRLRKQAAVFAVAGRVRFVRILTAVAASIFIVAGSILAFQQFHSTILTPGPGVDHPAGTQDSPDHKNPSDAVLWNQIKSSPQHDANR